MIIQYIINKMLNHSFYVENIRKPQLTHAQNAGGQKLFSTMCYIIDLRDLFDLSQISGLMTSNKPKTFLY